MTIPLPVRLGRRLVGPGHPPYLVAELSGNHNGDINRAFAIMEAAKQAGADAVKLQTYTPDTMTIDKADGDFLVKGGLWDGHSLYDLYKWAHTPWDWHPALFAKARELDIDIFSTPFDETAVDFLENLGNPIYKVASFEATDLPLITRIAATGKPMIVSTGMATLEEIADTVAVARAGGCTDLVLLHCISAYPAPVDEANLATIPDLARRFGTVVGLSDHTLSNDVSVAAIALGAAMIEKHFTLARADGGPDCAFSLEPAELDALCRSCRTAYAALGSSDYSRTPSEESSMVFRRSLYVVEDMRKGDEFTLSNVRRIRPGHGLPPKHLPEIIGRRASRDIPRGTRLDWDLIND